MDVTVIHEWLTNLAGSEKVVIALLRAFPEADVYTTLFEPDEFPDLDPGRVHTSWLHKMASGPSAHTRLAPLLPLAMRSLKIPPADLTITSFHNFALAARVPPGGVHVVYSHTPTRFVHARASMADERGAGRAIGAAARVYSRVDRRLGRKGDVWVANSHHIAKRIESAYGHRARVIHPPVDVDTFGAAEVEREDHYLVVGRLVPYKRADLAIEAFRGRDEQLVVVGDGRDRERLEQTAPPNVRFLGRVGGDALVKEMARAKALVFPGEEDFGIIPVEAMAAGTPVIAYGQGGILDSVVDGVTGCFFQDATSVALGAALDEFATMSWDHDVIAAHADSFSEQRFVERFQDLAAELVRD